MVISLGVGLLFHWAGTCHVLSIGKLYFKMYLIVSVFLNIITWADFVPTFFFLI